ncbi:ankyrin repeat domain-containing protein, partial [Parasphingorhabdus sp.]|uniref:ankyrin repeat domain-containing protein n=1 Tax=Parasphingorhabdus sp. TaxID=2709688 RepID=UPI0030A0820F
TGDIAKVAELLAVGSDPNARSPQGNTSLVLASCYGHFGVVRLLLDKGVGISVNSIHKDILEKATKLNLSGHKSGVECGLTMVDNLTNG